VVEVISAAANTWTFP